ncbi:MAG: membrane protein insertion efficiency factor YidD [Pseudomonadales bacterium]|jgi:putative membrane protein insertion efficiency factor
MIIKLISYMIKAYQYILSPLIGPRCRFAPTCSQYALESFQKHGLVRGLTLSLKRMGKCHPFHPGGVDEVPEISERLG